MAANINPEITFGQLREGIVRRYTTLAEQVYGAGNVTVSSVGDSVVLAANTTSAAVTQSVMDAERKPQNLHEAVRYWIVENGAAFQAVPYIRKETEKWKPKYSAEERGLMSLTGKIAHEIAEEGFNLSRPQNAGRLFEAEHDNTVRDIQEKISNLITSMIK